MFMSTQPDTKARHAAVLAELAEIGMAMARGLKDEMETAETPEAKARAVAAFPRVARAVRQCVALEARLERDAARDAVEDVRRERADVERRIRRRKVQVTTWMQRAICNDSPDDDDLTAQRMEDLRDRLDENLLDADFADRPLGEVIGRLCAALGLDPDRIMGEPDYGPDDPEDPDEDPDDGSEDDVEDGPDNGAPGGPGDGSGHGHGLDDPDPGQAPPPDPSAERSPWRHNYGPT